MDRAFHCRFHGNFRKDKVEKGLEVPLHHLQMSGERVDSSDSSSIYCMVPPFLFTPTKTYLLELPKKVEVDGR